MFGYEIAKTKKNANLKFTRSFVCSGVIMKKEKKIIKVVIVLLIAFIVVLAAIYINHRIQLNRDSSER